MAAANEAALVRFIATAKVQTSKNLVFMISNSHGSLSAAHAISSRDGRISA